MSLDPPLVHAPLYSVPFTCHSHTLMIHASTANWGSIFFSKQQTSHTRFSFSCTFCEISSNAEHVTNTLSHFLSDISVWKCFKNTAIIPSPHWAWQISVSLYIIICGRLFKLPVRILFKRKQWDNSKYQGNFIQYLIEFCPFWLLLTLLRLSSGSFNF